MKRLLAFSFLVISASAAAQHRCDIGGKRVIQETPCAAEKPGKFRCLVDGEVVYSDASCTTIKSKAQLASEAKEAAAAETKRRVAAAKVLEDADRKNFSQRISLAHAETSRNLRDPSSARFDASVVSWYSGKPVVCGLVAGRNGFGGYAAPVRFVTWDSWVTIDDGKRITAFDEHWDKYCGPLPRK